MMTLAIIRRALRRPLQWRLLVVSPLVLLVAASATLFSLAGFLGGVLDHATRWREMTSALDSSALASIGKALMTPAAAGLGSAIRTSVWLAVLFAPFLAGAALVVAEADARPRFRGLVAGAAGYYARLLRLQVAALVPLGIAALLAGVALGWASRVSDRATSETASHASGRFAWLVTVIVVFVAQLVVDAGRARLAAEPTRRSAVVALGAGVKLVVKRPVRALAVGLASTVPALAAAAVLLVIRQQITQSGVLALLLAFVLAQLAVAAIAWGHAAKLCGLVEIARELAASRGAAPVSELPTATASPSRAASPSAAAPPSDPAPPES
jgi:hypothetical protein